MWYAPVPALSTCVICEESAWEESWCRKTASAMGERQILPKQTKRTDRGFGGVGGVERVGADVDAEIDSEDIVGEREVVGELEWKVCA